MSYNADIIIIAASKSAELIQITQNCIDSVYRSNGKFNIVVIETLNKNQKYDNAKVLYFINKKFNYNKTINFGLSKTKNKIVGVFNNDLIFSKNWFDEILIGLEKYNSVSPFCPKSNIKTNNAFVESYLLRTGLNGWAIIFKREILKQIEKFNEDVEFWHSDNIYAEQLKQKGIKHALCTNSIVTHLGSKTLHEAYKNEQVQLTQNQKEKFKKINVNNYRFSIIMPCFLGEYKNAAANREEKLIRAVNSILNQTFQNFEIIIVSDGCEKTIELYQGLYIDNPKVKGYKIPKQDYMSGAVRQAGLQVATGEYIIYCDSDDIYLPNHLQFVNDNIEKLDWCLFDDNYYVSENEVSRKKVTLNLGISGTSSICHKRLLDVKWSNCNGYGHDWTFIQLLKSKSENYKHIGHGGYVICHVPGKFDF